MTLMVKNLSKSYGARRLFDNVSFFVGNNEKVALVGPNGSGKTTLVRIISGVESSDTGEVNIPGKNFRLGVLEQFSEFRPGNDVRTEAGEAFAGLKSIEKRLREFEERMESISGTELEKIGSEYASLLATYEEKGGYEYEADTGRVLTGIGFSESDWEKPVDVLSGGERTRLALCKLLLGKPDMLVLDEPTNHLDLPSVEWFEDFIAGYRGGCLIVSHDRYFIDRVADRILELDVDGVESYGRGYEKYVEARRIKLEQEWAAYNRQQEEIAKMERFVARWSADKIRGSQARDRQKKLDRIDRLLKPTEMIPRPGINLKKPERSFEKVLEVQGLRKAFDGREMFGGLDLEVSRGERLSIAGRNGEGKTTFLKCIGGELEPDEGTVRFGGKVEWGYFSQTHSELNLSHTVLEEFMRLRPVRKVEESRRRLGAYLFSEDDVLKLVGDISGGERSKLALAVLVDEEPNVLLLDEPTNHLDIPSREALERSLEAFAGSIIFVSHDRRFIDKLADKLLEFESGSTRLFHGNYNYYHEKKSAEEREISETEAKEKARTRRDEHKTRLAERKQRKPVKSEEEKRVEMLMKEISIFEGEISSLKEDLLKEEIYTDYEKTGEINKRLRGLGESLAIKEKELEGLL